MGRKSDRESMVLEDEEKMDDKSNIGATIKKEWKFNF